LRPPSDRYFLIGWRLSRAGSAVFFTFTYKFVKIKILRFLQIRADLLRGGSEMMGALKPYKYTSYFFICFAVWGKDFSPQRTQISQS